jgi:hypothetical protein
VSGEEEPKDKYLQSTYPLLAQKLSLQKSGQPASYALFDQDKSYA